MVVAFSQRKIRLGRRCNRQPRRSVDRRKSVFPNEQGGGGGAGGEIPKSIRESGEFAQGNGQKGRGARTGMD